MKNQGRITKTVINFGLALVIIHHFLLPVIHAKSCSDICGVAEEEQEENIVTDDEPVYVTDEQTRSQTIIVNGWNALPRPWMVLIRAIDPNDPTDFDTCGGAVLNDRFVLTAAHCVCLVGSRRTPCQGGQLQYEAREVFRLYVGLNDANLKRVLPKHAHLYEHLVDQVIVHPDWTGTGLTFPDLSLMKTGQRLKLVPGRVVPICLPANSSSLFSLDKGYVAGWGLTRNEDCFTDNFGPSRHARCRFPFKYAGHELQSCIKAQSPSGRNPKCRQLAQFLGKDALPKKGESVLILYGSQRKRTVCYSPHSGDHGWCGVCIQNAKPGEYGYCVDGFPPPEDDELITEAKPSRHWGFCSKLCDQSSMRAQQLKETRLSVLDSHSCGVFNNSMLLYRDKVEFCAGHKMSYPLMRVYKRFKVRKEQRHLHNGNKYVFKLVAKRLNTLGAEKAHRTLGYYLGESDSCQGDSGGPFYVFKDKKAYVIGVVSRGGQCAGFNQPGIYTDVRHQKWRQWIEDAIQEGQC